MIKIIFTVKFDVSESTGKTGSRLNEQLDRLLEEGYVPEDMIVFPIPNGSGSLADISRIPGIEIERIGPDVVRVRRPKNG